MSHQMDSLLYCVQQLFIDFVNCRKYNKHILNEL